MTGKLEPRQINSHKERYAPHAPFPTLWYRWIGIIDLPRALQCKRGEGGPVRPVPLILPRIGCVPRVASQDGTGGWTWTRSNPTQH